MVVLDHLLKQCPVVKEDVVSQGGEIKRARSGLGNVLEKHGIPKKYLKEVTTRQGHQDGQRLFELLDWGKKLSSLPENERNDILHDMVGVLANFGQDWMKRQNLKLDIDRRHTPTAWIHQIVENAKSRSGGIVEQHLIGAKLERRYKDKEIPNHPAHAADIQTARDGDGLISNSP